MVPVSTGSECWAVGDGAWLAVDCAAVVDDNKVGTFEEGSSSSFSAGSGVVDKPQACPAAPTLLPYISQMFCSMAQSRQFSYIVVHVVLAQCPSIRAPAMVEPDEFGKERKVSVRDNPPTQKLGYDRKVSVCLR